MTNEICKHGNKIGECGAANCPFMLILTPNTESWQQEYDKVLGIEGDYRDTLIKSFIVGLLEDMRLNAKREVVEEAKREIRRLLRTSNDALDTVYITDIQTRKLLPVPKGNNTEDSYYNLALIEAEKSIDDLNNISDKGEPV